MRMSGDVGKGGKGMGTGRSWKGHKPHFEILSTASSMRELFSNVVGQTGHV